MLHVLVSKTLVWYRWHHVFAISSTKQSRSSPFVSCQHLLGRDDNCTKSVLSSNNDLNTSRWQSGEICQVLCTGAFTLLCHVLLISFTLVLLSCSRVSLLDFSRLFGLTLRPLAPACSCHQNSLTRWRLALAQEAACDASSVSSQLFFCSSVCLVISGNVRGTSLQAMQTFEGPVSSFFHAVLDHLIGIRLETLEKCYVFVL